MPLDVQPRGERVDSLSIEYELDRGIGPESDADEAHRAFRATRAPTGPSGRPRSRGPGDEARMIMRGARREATRPSPSRPARRTSRRRSSSSCRATARRAGRRRWRRTSRGPGWPRSGSADRPSSATARISSYAVAPSSDSRRMSACPACRAASAIRCSQDPPRGPGRRPAGPTAPRAARTRASRSGRAAYGPLGLLGDLLVRRQQAVQGLALPHRELVVPVARRPGRCRASARSSRVRTARRA